jgi:hypothetical protein
VEYRGRLFTADGRPLATAFHISLESAHRKPGPLFHTDADGRFCVALPRDSGPEYVKPETTDSAAPPDPRFAKPPAGATSTILLVPPVAVPAVETLDGPGNYKLWSDAQDRARACERPELWAAWYRFSDHGSTWQSHLLWILTLGGAWAAVVVVLLGRKRPGPAPALQLGVLALSLVDLALVAALWHIGG